MEFGVWSLEFGVWSLEFGVWSLLVVGDWRLCEKSQSSTESSPAPFILARLPLLHLTGTEFPSALGVRDRPSAQPAGIGRKDGCRFVA